MKAVRIHAFGGPEVLQIDQLESPALQPGQVRIQTLAAGVNPIDWKTREGGGAATFLGEPPIILGWECCGDVVEVHPQESRFQPGDRVAGLLNFPEAGNCYADEIVADAGQLGHCEPSLDPVAAAGLPLAGLTAWQALFEGADLQPGQKVLVLAGAGGVGHLAVQLAKWKGAWVAATASTANQDYLKALGCDQAIDYEKQQVGDQVRELDVIIDAVGGATAIEALSCLKDSGVMVTLPSVTATEVVAAAAQLGVKAHPIRVRSEAGQLQQLLQLMQQGKLALRLDRSYPVEQVAEAHRHSQGGHARGKIVLTF